MEREPRYRIPSTPSGLTFITSPIRIYLVVGNADLFTSRFGTPSGSIVGADGSIASMDFLKNTSARGQGFTTLLPMTGGEFAYLTETYFSSPDLDWRGYLTGTGVYERAIF